MKKKIHKNNKQCGTEQTQEEYTEKLEDGTKLNTSNELNKTKKFAEYEFSNIQCTNKNGQTVLIANVKNTSGTAKKSQLVNVIFIDKNGQELLTVGGIISPLEAGETKQFNVSITLDYANAYDFKITKK